MTKEFLQQAVPLLALVTIVEAFNQGNNGRRLVRSMGSACVGNTSPEEGWQVSIMAVGKPKLHVVGLVVAILAVVVVVVATELFAMAPTGKSDEWLRWLLPLSLLGGGGHIAHGILADASTRFTDAGVHRRTIWGARVYSWAAVVSIGGRGNLVDFRFVNGAFRCNLLLFKDARELVAFVRSRVPSSKISAS